MRWVDAGGDGGTTGGEGRWAKRQRAGSGKKKQAFSDPGHRGNQYVG